MSNVPGLGHNTSPPGENPSEYSLPILPGESNLPGIERYCAGASFNELYDQTRLQDPSLPALGDFLERHQTEIERMDQAAGVQVEWCTEAKNVLDQRYGPGQYYVVTAERGARNIRYIMHLLGVEARPVWANTDFFYADSPENWDDVAHSLVQQNVDGGTMLNDPRHPIVLDTGFTGTVIKGFTEFSALQLNSAESTEDYASRIAEQASDGREVVVVGATDFGLKAALTAHGAATSSLLKYKYRLSELGGPERIDAVLKGEQRIAREFEGQDNPTIAEKLHRGDNILFVTTEVDPEHPDYRALVEYLAYLGAPTNNILARHISDEQAALLSRMDGYMVAANSSSLYGELIDPSLPFARRAQLIESGPAFMSSVSRDQIRPDGTIAFNYLSAEDQLLAALYTEILAKKAEAIRARADTTARSETTDPTNPAG